MLLDHNSKLVYMLAALSSKMIGIDSTNKVQTLLMSVSNQPFHQLTLKLTFVLVKNNKAMFSVTHKIIKNY